MQQWSHCPNCFAVVALGARFCGNCGYMIDWTTHQQPPSPHQTTRPPKNKSQMNWFERHLNWTIVLAYLGAWIANLIVFIFVGSAIVQADPHVSGEAIRNVRDIIIGTITLAVLIPTWGWSLRRKNRSLWWLLLGLLVPFGGIALLVLKNRSQISET